MTSQLQYNQYEFDDFVFENRNTRFGAYELRDSYYKRLFIPMLLIFVGFTAFIFCLHFTFPVSKHIIADPKNPTVDETDRVVPIPDLGKTTPKPPTSKGSPAPIIAETEDSVSVQDTLQQTATTSNSTEEGFENGIEGGTSNSGNGTSTGGTSKPDTIALEADRDPEFVGGPEAMALFIGKHLRYPAKAEKAGEQGEVHVSFVVEEDGSITNIKVMRGLITKECNDEAVRVISKMPIWKPAIFMGKPTRTRMKIPIRYVLPEE